MKKSKEDLYTIDDLENFMSEEDYKDLVKCIEEDDTQFLNDDFDDEEQED